MAAPDLRTAVRTGAAHLDAMAAELAELERAHRVTEPAYADLQHRYEVLGGYTLDQRVDATLSGLGLRPGRVGQAARARCPAASRRGRRWPASSSPTPSCSCSTSRRTISTSTPSSGSRSTSGDGHGSLIVASHDRAFLDATVTPDLGAARPAADGVPGRLQPVPPPARRARRCGWARTSTTQADAIARERELVQRYRSHRKFSQDARARGSPRAAPGRADRGAQADRAGSSSATPALTGAGPARSGEIVVRAEDLVVGYLPRLRRESDDSSEQPPLEPLVVARVPFLAAQRGERIGIVGPNGAGKTTLLRTIAGELPPLDGTLTIGGGVSIGYLAQLRGAAIPGTTVLDALLEAIPVTPGEARGYLARFLFRGDDAFKEVRTLSGGERSRLELALLGILPANLLLLDEPTNHLDIPAREAIEAFLRETAGDAPRGQPRPAAARDGLRAAVGRRRRAAAAFDGGYRAWRAAVADGWTVAGAIEAEARRLRTGGRPVAGTVVAGVLGEPAPIDATAETAGHGARLGQAPATVGAARTARTADGAEAVEGRLPPPAGRARRRAHPARPAQEPPRAGDGRPGGRRQLRRAAPDHERAGRRHLALEAAEESWLELEERAP